VPRNVSAAELRRENLLAVMEKPGATQFPELEGLGLSPERQLYYNRFRFWRIVIVCSLFYSFYYLGRLNWGICLPWMLEDLGISKTQAGVGATLLLWSYAAGTFFSGRFGEVLGQRFLCTVGGIGTTILNVVVAMATTLTGILVPWTINGFVQGQAYAPINGMISNWYPKARRGLATGIFATSMGLSTIVAWAVTGFSCAAFGWRWAFTWPLIGLTLPTTLLVTFLARNKPEDADLPPYKELSTGISAKAEQLSADEVAGLKAWAAVLRNPKFVAMCVASFAVYVARYGLLTWIPLFYKETADIALKNLPIMTFALPIGMAVGPVVSGWLSDKVFGAKRWQVIAGNALVAAIVLVCMGFIPIQTMGLTWAVVLQVVAGMVVLGVNGALFTAACDFGGRRLAGTCVGTINLFNYFGAGFQGIIIGRILDLSGSWAMVWGFCAGLLVLTVIIAAVVRE